MSINIILLAPLLLAPFVHADEIRVVDVRRNITLSDNDPIYKDFYINAGDGSSLRKNMVVNVKRKINVRDSSTKSVGDFETTVGQLKIIQVGNKVSVAREYKLTPRDEEPMLEQLGIMSGDRIDTAGAYIDNSKPAKKKTADESTPVGKPENVGPTEAVTPPTQLTAPTASAASVIAPATFPTQTAATDTTTEQRTPANETNKQPEVQKTVQPETMTPTTLPANKPIPMPQI